MKLFQTFSSGHDTFIHDMDYDYYGKRIVSCSSDRKLKIWQVENGKEWVLQTEWIAHQGSVWKATWAHPEFGQLIASCSFDRSVSIWEEQTPAVNETGKEVAWRLQAQLVDAKESVHAIAFSPRHLGLRIATASADGVVRMYEAIDVLNLSHWPLQEEFMADKSGALCVSWNESRFDMPMVVVGGNEPIARVWAYNSAFHRWQNVADLKGHTDAVHDVAWAPNMGRSYHLIATASKDRSFRIYKLSLANDHGSDYMVEQVTMQEHQQAAVWQVEWNVTGTMLATSGDDGVVRMWKADFEGKWTNVSSICGDLNNAKPTYRVHISWTDILYMSRKFKHCDKEYQLSVLQQNKVLSTIASGTGWDKILNSVQPYVHQRDDNVIEIGSVPDKVRFICTGEFVKVNANETTTALPIGYGMALIHVLDNTPVQYGIKSIKHKSAVLQVGKGRFVTLLEGLDKNLVKKVRDMVMQDVLHVHECPGLMPKIAGKEDTGVYDEYQVKGAILIIRQKESNDHAVFNSGVDRCTDVREKSIKRSDLMVTLKKFQLSKRASMTTVDTSTSTLCRRPSQISIQRRTSMSGKRLPSLSPTNGKSDHSTSIVSSTRHLPAHS